MKRTHALAGGKGKGSVGGRRVELCCISWRIRSFTKTDSDKKWMQGLTPMTRLFLAAGLSSVGVSSVHFIDGTHSSFASLPTGSESGEQGGLRGEGTRDSNPRQGQVGVFQMDRQAYDDQFILSRDQPLPERLVVSAPPSSTHGANRGQGLDFGGGIPAASRRGVPVGSRGVPAVEDTVECVKYVGRAGTWGEKRDKWFPNGAQDARSLQLALHNFCPMSWLEEEDEAGVGKQGDANAGDGVGTGQVEMYRGGQPGFSGQRGSRGLVPHHYNSQPRKVIIYQRDRNRKLLESHEVATELWERLGNIGWSVEEIVHDADRHPCELVHKISNADVLLTAHGFQSMLILFMRPGTVLFEVFPHNYFKDGYKPLTSELGMRYAYSSSKPMLSLTKLPFFPSRETCMKWHLCRSYVRWSDVQISEESLEVLISLMLEGGQMPLLRP